MIGEKTGAYAVTMETTALPNLDYHLKHELGPGEIVEITEGGVIQKHAPGDTTKNLHILLGLLRISVQQLRRHQHRVGPLPQR